MPSSLTAHTWWLNQNINKKENKTTYLVFSSWSAKGGSWSEIKNPLVHYCGQEPLIFLLCLFVHPYSTVQIFKDVPNSVGGSTNMQLNLSRRKSTETKAPSCCERPLTLFPTPTHSQKGDLMMIVDPSFRQKSRHGVSDRQREFKSVMLFTDCLFFCLCCFRWKEEQHRQPCSGRSAAASFLFLCQL